ncbi:MAG: hypothetical protein AB7O96_07595 [Pseudobdellovibrionaceae bacterium]
MRTVLQITLLLFLVGCAKPKTAQNNTDDAPIKKETPVEATNDQKLDELMKQVGSVHSPSSEELTANRWCGVDADLRVKTPDYNNIKFFKNELFKITMPIADEGVWSAHNGTWILGSNGISLVTDNGPQAEEQAAEISIAKNSEIALIKIALKGEPSFAFKGRQNLFYRNCEQ